jgi:hypothetical protein
LKGSLLLKNRLGKSFLISFLLLAHTVCAAPRLLRVYLAYGPLSSNEITLSFTFSERMDPNHVVFPNADASNPNRSYDLFRFPPFIGYPGDQGPVPLNATGVVSLENGRILEITGDNTIWDRESYMLNVYSNGFISIFGEPLDKDYHFPYPIPCQLCVLSGTPVIAVWPPPNFALQNPEKQITIYLGKNFEWGPGDGIAPSQFQRTLKLGPEGPLIETLQIYWDMPAGRNQFGEETYRKITVIHPRLEASPKPYVFNTNYFNAYFTVGPVIAGDMNDDNAVDVTDAILALKASLGLIVLTDTQQFAADIAPRPGTGGRAVGDGQVDVADVVKVLRRAVEVWWRRDADWP